LRLSLFRVAESLGESGEFPKAYSSCGKRFA
jgi:hypothetical protein